MKREGEGGRLHTCPHNASDLVPDTMAENCYYTSTCPSIHTSKVTNSHLSKVTSVSQTLAVHGFYVTTQRVGGRWRRKGRDEGSNTNWCNILKHVVHPTHR